MVFQNNLTTNCQSRENMYIYNFKSLKFFYQKLKSFFLQYLSMNLFVISRRNWQKLLKFFCSLRSFWALGAWSHLDFLVGTALHHFHDVELRHPCPHALQLTGPPLRGFRVEGLIPVPTTQKTEKKGFFKESSSL